jgi:NADPH:quinone reductase-like Zn-dependent oxidoreductase
MMRNEAGKANHERETRCPENPELESVADLAEPGAEEVRVRVLVTSAAFTDVMIRQGMYSDVKDKPPFTAGYDMVGIVDATGPGATRFTLGDRVANLTTIGAYAEYICLREDRLTRVSRAYFDAIEAPVKGFDLFDNSAHSPLFEEPDRATQILLNDVLGERNALADAR